LESFSDYANRLPRGRTYVRNGSVCHLAIRPGEIAAKVAGSELHDVRLQIKTLPAKKWKAIKERCAGKIGSLLELLQGKLSEHVMQVVTDRRDGMFPAPAEISLRCSCPDWAVMCKHVAAVLYGIGARLDQQPELLFTLRGVDHEELIAADAEAAVSAATSRSKSKRLADDELADVFGIDLKVSEPQATKKTTQNRSFLKKTADARPRGSETRKKRGKKTSAKKVSTAKDTQKKPTTKKGGRPR